MAYNTGNPIGSTDARDLYDNAANLDQAMNSTGQRWTDRFGISRPTWASAGGYFFLGDYEAAIEITGYNQVVRQDGEYWKLETGQTLPYTTTGDWSTDGVDFVSVGDAVLRQDLANSTPGMGADLVAIPTTQAETDAGATIADHMKPFPSIERYGADGAGDDTAAFEEAVSVGAVHVPAGSWTQTAVDVTRSVRISGEGGQSIIDQGFVVPVEETGDLLLEVHDLAANPGSGGGGAILSAETGSPANVDVRADNVHSENGDSIINLPVAGELRGIIRGFSGKDLGGVGVRLGYNDENAQANWGPVIITGGIVDGLFPPDSASHYALISYVPNSVISSYVARNVGNTGGGAGTEAVYTKAKGSVIANGVHVDGGLDEGAMNIKGGTKGATDNPLGYNVVAVGHVFEWTDAYIAADGDPTTLTGVNLANDNLLFGAALFFNGSGRAIHTASAELDSVGIFDVAILDGAYADGGIYHQSSGRGHTVRGATIRNIDGPGIKTRGAETDSTFDYSDILVDDALYGWVIRPSADNIADYTLRNSTIRATTGAAILFDGPFKPRSVTIENVNVGDFRSRATFNYDATAIVPTRWRIRDLNGHGQTTDATLRNFASLKVPQGKMMSITVRATANNGTTASLVTEKRACFKNTAGTVTQYGTTQTVGAINPDSVTWDVTFGISGELVVVYVNGAAATTVEWAVSLDADCP
jgi:hypothetical protein